jgi:hypothetical protein
MIAIGQRSCHTTPLQDDCVDYGDVNKTLTGVIVEVKIACKKKVGIRPMVRAQQKSSIPDLLAFPLCEGRWQPLLP